MFETTLASAHWKKIGAYPHHGIALAIFSLRSQNSSGIGEFTDLLPLIPWCASLGMDVIQLLPLNDTGRETSPYSAISAYALNPIHLGLAALPDVQKVPKYQERLKELKRFNHTQRVHYFPLFEERDLFLRDYFKVNGDALQLESSFQQFVQKNSWLHSYALFKSLKIANDWKSWEHWRILQASQKEISYHIFLQYLCFLQMEEVKKTAFQNGVFLKGDLPILINRDSADVWSQRDLFDLRFSAGAPPDMYAPEGQNWGFPIYNWKAHEAEDYRFWKNRLACFESIYDIYRLDHVVGFYRIWAIPKGKNAKYGHFIPVDSSLWIPQGEKILSMLLAASSLFPIAEDLGTVPPQVRTSLNMLGIPGTKILRWERFWDGDRSYIPLQDYLLGSMSSVSTHDSETLTLWWLNSPEDVRRLCQLKGWSFTYEPTREQLKEILYDSHHTTSLFHINLLQEYLQCVPGLTWLNPEEERINTPSTVSPKNWSYRFRLFVEEIIQNKALQSLIQSVKC